MDWIAAKVIVNSGNVLLAEELITDIFQTLGIQGGVVEQPDMEPEEGWGEDALPKPEFFSVTGYMPDDEELEQIKKELDAALKALALSEKIETRTEFAVVRNEDWAETWKEFFWPQNITENIVIKPSWREYTEKEGDIIIEIDPGMAFGTGTHPTTSMCVTLIEKYIKEQDSFLDVGTGSGILMIAASHFSKGKMTGIDIDETAIEVAEENLVKNSVDPKQYHLMAGNLADDITEKYDLVAANILAEVIVVLLDNIRPVIKDDGLFVCSGIIDEKADMVLDKLKEVGLKPVEILRKDSWTAIVSKPE